MFNQKIVFDIPNCPVYIGKFDHKNKGMVCQNHFHSELEFLYVKKGKMRFYIMDSVYDVDEGEVFLVLSNIPHYTEIIKDDTTSILLQFSDPQAIGCPISYLPGYIKKQSHEFYIFKNNDSDIEIIRDYIEKVLEEKLNKEKSYDYYITAYIHNITALLHRKNILYDAAELMKTKEIEKLFPLFSYVDQNYYNKISLAEMAALMHLNEYYLCRLFKRLTGNTLVEYINFVRIFKAEKMLNGELSLSEIAYHCGFSSLSYFNKTFKKYKLYSPKEYKKIMMNIQLNK